MVVILKACLLGDGAVGKTALKDVYVGGTFTKDYKATLGSDFVIKPVTIDTSSGEQELKLQIWDLAGQPLFKQVRTMYYKGASGGLLIFDVTKPETLDSLAGWLEELYKNSQTSHISIVVLGNKIDLREGSEGSITAETAKGFIEQNLLTKYPDRITHIPYFETSAKTGENVEASFQDLANQIFQKGSPS